MTCVACNGIGRQSLPNPAWTPATPREATATVGAHGRLYRNCDPCKGTGNR